MKKGRKTLTGILMVVVVLLLLGVSYGYAAIPNTINYQGYLTDSGGNPVNATVSMTFKIYAVSTGGTALWSESQNTVLVNNGIYNVTLGSVVSLGALPFDVPYFLGVTVGTDSEMTPRQTLTSVGYAFTADTALDLVCANCVSLAEVDQAAIQRRVTGTCTAGNSIRVINQDGTVTCETDDGITVETDPQVGAVTAGKWCTGDGAAVQCSQNPPLLSESDPQVGTLTSGKWCTSDGTTVNCLQNAPSAMGTNFIGTTDNNAFEVKVNNARALRIEPNSTSPNIIGGYIGNSITGGVYGSTIGGGGTSTVENRVTDNYGTIGGGAQNQAGDNAGTTDDARYATVGGGRGNNASAYVATVGGGRYNTASGKDSTVPGGRENAAAADYSFAAGHRSKANHMGSFVWAVSTDADFASTATDQFAVRASGGVKFETDKITVNTAKSYLWISGNGVRKYRDADSTIIDMTNFGGAVIQRGATTGNKNVMLPITVMGPLYGQDVKITGVDIYWKGETEFDAITAVLMRRQTGVCSTSECYLNIKYDDVDHGCAQAVYPTGCTLHYDITTDNVLSADSGILYLTIEFAFSGATTHIWIGGVRLTLEHS